MSYLSNVAGKDLAEGSSLYSNKKLDTPELYIFQCASTMPPNEVFDVYDFTIDGFAPLFGATGTAVYDRTNGIGEYVLEINGDGATANPVWRMVLGTSAGRNYSVNLRINYVSGTGQVVTLAGMTTPIDIDVTSSGWKNLDFNISDDANYVNGVILGVQGFQATSKIQLKISIKEI